MTARILSTHGNVIAADFKPRASFDITVSFASETLYCDGAVTLVRVTASLADRPLAVMHYLGDLATGHIVQLSNTGNAP